MDERARGVVLIADELAHAHAYALDNGWTERQYRGASLLLGSADMSVRRMAGQRITEIHAATTDRISWEALLMLRIRCGPDGWPGPMPEPEWPRSTKDVIE